MRSFDHTFEPYWTETPIPRSDNRGSRGFVPGFQRHLESVAFEEAYDCMLTRFSSSNLVRTQEQGFQTHDKNLSDSKAP
jgi:hypothetical protein